MKTYSEMFLEIINREVDKEIGELEELVSILSDSNSIVDSGDTSTDVKIIQSRMSAYKDIKGMVLKTSIKIDGFDSENLMTEGEKKWLYRLMRIIRFFRKLFRRS